MAVLELDEIKKNINARVLITIPGKRAVQAIVQSDLTVTGSNQFNNPFESQQQATLSALTTNLQAVAERTKRAVGIGTPGTVPISLQTIEGSMKSWVGSSAPSFNLQLAFVALRETDDVRKDTLRLYETVYPIFKGALATDTVRAPLNYLPVGREAQGTLIIEIGQWFRGFNLVMDNVEFTFSKEVIESGAPLVATGSIQFSPFRVISFDELKQFLRVSDL